MSPFKAVVLRASAVTLVVLATLSGRVTARAPDCDWLAGEGPSGTDGAVLATTSWDPDGAGPLPEQLIVGGSFAVAGDVVANCIAAWDGSSFQPLGSGMGGGSYGAPFVYALTVHNGELIAGGDFTTAGGTPCNSIARWNGTYWQLLGSGMGGGSFGAPSVYALTVYNGQLIAAGDFTTAGGAPCNNIARGTVAPGRRWDQGLTPKCAP